MGGGEGGEDFLILCSSFFNIRVLILLFTYSTPTRGAPL